MGNETRYLQKLGHSWYVRITVPRSLRPLIGNDHIRRALHTRDLDEANRRKWKMVEVIKSELNRMRGLDALNVKALQLRSEIRNAITSRHPELEGIIETTRDYAADIATEMEQRVGLDKAKQWYDLATAETKTLDELADEWLIESDYLKITKKQHRKIYEDFKTYLGGDNIPSVVSEDTANNYVEDVIKKSGLAYETQRRTINSLSAFWTWMGRKKHVSRLYNPWKGFRLSKAKTPKNTPDKRAYADEELVQLFSMKPPSTLLGDLMVLGLYTGTRMSELCNFMQGDIKKIEGGYTLSIRKSKTKAGTRTIAVAHDIPCSIIKRRCDFTDPDKQLFTELKRGGYDDKLSSAMSPVFMRFRDRVGLTGATDFHSLRRTLITLMENLGIDQVRIARYVGHNLPTLAFSLYSKGSTLQTNIAVAREIKYPDQIEKTIINFLK